MLARKYLTPASSDYIFGGFLEALNQGLILRDNNNYTQFSKNNELIIDFYQRYFDTEAVSGDL